MRRGLLLTLVALLLLARPAAAQIVGLPQGITVIDSGTACVTAPTACAIFALDNQTGGLTLGVSGTWTGTLTWEGTNNDASYTSLLATNLATGAQATTTTANGLFAITNAGVIKIRARATGAITGTAVLTAAKGIGFARLFGGAQSFSQITIISPGTGVVLTNNATNFLNVAGSLTTAGGLNAAAANFIAFVGRAAFNSPSDGNMVVGNAASTIGSQFKVDALPTIGSGFGASPAVVAGSTPFAGSVDVGTGGAATTGVITFGGTAFPATPKCTYSTTTTNGVTRGTPTTTQLTLNSTTAWTANDIVAWICVSSK